VIYYYKNVPYEVCPSKTGQPSFSSHILNIYITAAIGNAILIFITFLLAIPGILMPTSRGWLKAHGAMVVVCGLFTLVIGLDIWFETLKTRENLGVLWNQQSNDIQSLLQRGVRLFLSSSSSSTSLHTTYTNISLPAQLLRLPQQHIPSLCPRYHLLKPSNRPSKRWLRPTILVIRE
jgi:hypothetical protein